MKRKANDSHITLEGRKIIEEKLNENVCITSIADQMKREKSTIAREINRHIVYVFPSTFNNSHPCKKSRSCPVKSENCYNNCKNIEINLCPRLTSSPHTCNGCNHKSNCRYVKKYYKANEANSEYLSSWVNDRIGMKYTEEELNILNTDFYNLVIYTKSIYHSLIVINKMGYNFKQSSIYRQIKQNKLLLKTSDLPRNRKNKTEPKDKEYKNKESIEGHMIDDYNKYKENNPNAIETQMDTVIGIINGKDPVILTLEIVEISFMFIFKLNSKTSQEVINKLLSFQNIISKDIFNKICEILLTDNGSEFKKIKDLVSTFPKINIFYCHPYASYEKGSIENNHEFIRRVIPKGVSLKPYTQNDYNLLASHINSLYRKKLNGKCPFDLISEYIPLDILKNMGLNKIQDTNINLTPFLLGDKNVENIKKYLDLSDIKKANITLIKND